MNFLLQSVGEAFYKWHEVDITCRLHNPLVRNVRTETDIGFDRAREQKDILQHDSKGPPQIVQVQGRDVPAVEEYLPTLNVVETSEQIRDCRLAGSGMSDNRDRLSRKDLKRNVAQHPVFPGIGEPDMTHVDP